MQQHVESKIKAKEGMQSVPIIPKMAGNPHEFTYDEAPQRGMRLFQAMIHSWEGVSKWFENYSDLANTMVTNGVKNDTKRNYI